MDVLSEVLTAIRMDGAIYINAEFAAPWCAEAQHGLHRAARQLPRADNIIFFHLLTEGRCSVRLADGRETVNAVAGDLLLFPHDHLHILGSDLGLPPADVNEIIDASAD